VRRWPPDDVLVGVVEVRAPFGGHDAGLGLQDDLGTLGRRQLQRFGEPPLAAVVAAVDVRMVEEVDPGLARRPHQLLDVVVGHLADAHHPERHVGHGQIGARHGECLHCGTSRAGLSVMGVSSPTSVAARPSRERSGLASILYGERGLVAKQWRAPCTNMASRGIA